MAQNKNKHKEPSVRIQIPLKIAETLYGFIDGALGSSECDSFSREMGIVEERLKRAISKHYK